MILATWIRSLQQGILVSVSSFRCLDVQVCVYITSVHTYVDPHGNTGRYAHTAYHFSSLLLIPAQMFVPQCTHTYYTLSTISWVWSPKSWLSKLPNSLHLSGVSWQLLTANYSPGADQPFKETWQLAAEDKIRRWTHIMLTTWWSGTEVNKLFWIITAEYLFPDQHQRSGIKRRSQEDITWEYRGEEEV